MDTTLAMHEHAAMAAAVSAVEPDWNREQPRRWMDPGNRALRNMRTYQRLRSDPSRNWLRRALCAWHAMLHCLWSAVAGMEISRDCHIAGGLMLPHPNGIVIHPQARIGPNCLIFQQVTIGDGGRISGVPRIGGHVDIGAGARLLGGIHVGNHVKIGANAVVLQDVPEGATAVGVPARIIAPASTAKTPAR